jgi:hypothetical protein
MTQVTPQAAFARALLDPIRPEPDGLVAWNGSDPARRFAVHRNNVVVSLIGALADRFPVVRELVGSEFFDAMAREFVLAHPPRSPLMMLYGERFPGFIAAFAPAASVPYLADVAALEAARTRAWHAADAPTLGPEAFRKVAPDALFALRAELHPSAQVLTSRFAIVSLWSAHQGTHRIEDVDPSCSEDALVVRPRDEVEVVSLPVGVAAFIGRLRDGVTLGAAAAAVQQSRNGFDLTAALRILVATGVVTRLSFNDGDSP